MVQGKKKPNYQENSFPYQMEQIIGNDISNGLIHLFEAYHITFSQAETALIANAEAYRAEYESEDFEVRKSMFFGPFHGVQSYPRLYLLRDAYMITLHATFESIWKDVSGLYEEHFEKANFPSIRYKYFDEIKARSLNFIDEILEKYQIFFDYNYIRNSFTHTKGKGPDFTKVIELISQGKLVNLYTVDATDVVFEITSLDFVYGYGNLIISFLTEIQDKAYEISLM